MDEPLGGDGMTSGIVRVGDVVRRPARSYTATVHAFLEHLHANGFDAAPVPLSLDDEHEELTFVHGDVPLPPLPGWACTDAAIEELAHLVRRQHDASATWRIPPGAEFGTIPGTPPETTTLDGPPQLVAHQDYCPGNVVFRDGLPAALIDFDLARPTTRLLDCVNAVYWWAPLTDPRDRSPAQRTTDSCARARRFADAYGLDTDQRERFAALAHERSATARVSVARAVDHDAAFRRMFTPEVLARLDRATTWIATNQRTLTEALTA